MKNIYLFYSMPRSGSTPVSKVLGHYFESIHKYTYLEEYFNSDFLGDRWDGDKITVDLLEWQDVSSRFLLPIQERVRQGKEKLQHLLISTSEEKNHKYSLKMFPYFDFQLSTEYEKLASKSHVIFIARKDVFDHLLSYLLSFSTLKFYDPMGLKFEKRSVEAKESDFRKFLVDLAIFTFRMREQRRPRVVFYEDFLQGGPQKILFSLGFKRKLDWSSIPIPMRQNSGDKLSLFLNSDKIISWYQSSCLHETNPIDSTGKYI